jgi:hypothetical protein
VAIERLLVANDDRSVVLEVAIGPIKTTFCGIETGPNDIELGEQRTVDEDLATEHRAEELAEEASNEP